MKRAAGTLVLILMGAAGLAAAQTTPGAAQEPPSSMGQQEPNSMAPPAQAQSQQPSTTSGDASGAPTKAEKKAMIKDCVTKQQASNSGMSKHQATKYCKQQIEQSSSQPQQ